MGNINEFRKDYFYLSNYYPVEVTYKDLTYQSSEAAYQAQKCKREKDKIAFTTMTADESKKAGRRVDIREDWEEAKFGIMLNIVYAKFSQNPELAKKLLATGSSYLEEGNDWGDTTWGTVNGVGGNMLGHILMIVRNRLRSND